MFQSQRKMQILAHLNGIPKEDRSPFDCLLADWMDGRMKNRLKELGVRRLSVHIGWQDNSRGIYIEGRLGERYLELEIEPFEFSYACSDIEPDDHLSLPLQSAEQIYAVIEHLAA